jgi:hypothetical protein
VSNQEKTNKGRWIVAAMLTLGSMLDVNQVQAGTAAYFAKCSFLDRGNNNGGSVSEMPCYAVEGANSHKTAQISLPLAAD